MARKITVIPAQSKQLQVDDNKPQKIRVAAYCRVSTDQEEQLNSYENQIRYYKSMLSDHPEYELVDIYADEGISGTNTKKRAEFNRMIQDCRNHKIDRIFTKSISRFARNTLDCLNYIRELQGLGIEIIFENENIKTLDGQGEVLITILASLSQNTSMQISSNSKWGIHRRYEQGKYAISTTRFLGYDIDENGKLAVNPKQAKVVERLYREFMAGKTVGYIARIFTKEKVKNWEGKVNWHASTLQSMLENEKYKGDAILQKGYTADFLTKRRAKNEGQLQSFYIEDDHEAIIDPDTWNCVQKELERRKKFMEEHDLKAYGNNTEKNPFACKIICGDCGKAYTRKGWRKGNGETRLIWQCIERYRVKGVLGCSNRHIDDSTLHELFIMAWNKLVVEKRFYTRKWKENVKEENLLKRYYAREFIHMVDDIGMIETMETNHMLATLDSLKVFSDGQIIITFLEGTEITIKCE